MSQSLVAAQSNTPVLVARVFVKPEPLLLLNLPLNVFLKPGLTMQIDNGRKTTYAFEICNEQGCHLGIPLDADLVTALKRGNFARYTFRDGAGSEITVPMDLRGFTKSWEALADAVQ